MAEHNLGNPLILSSLDSCEILTPEKTRTRERGERLNRPLNVARKPTKPRTEHAKIVEDNFPPGSQIAGKKKFSFKGVLDSATGGAEKLKEVSIGGFSLKDIKMDDIILVALVIIMLNEKDKEYDILLILAYLFIVGFLD